MHPNWEFCGRRVTGRVGWFRRVLLVLYLFCVEAVVRLY